MFTEYWKLITRLMANVSNLWFIEVKKCGITRFIFYVFIAQKKLTPNFNSSGTVSKCISNSDEKKLKVA